jgi:hypothetical protein
VLVRPAHRRGLQEAADLLQVALRTYPVAAEWEWNPDRCVAARARGEPIHREAMAEELGLFGAGRIVSAAARSRWWPPIRRSQESP